MATQVDKLLHSDKLLQNYGFTRLLCYKIGPQHYSIHLCPSRHHLCLLTSNLIYQLLSKNVTGQYCLECAESSYAIDSEKLTIMAENADLLHSLFFHIKGYPNCQLAKLITELSSTKNKYKHYISVREQHLRDNMFSLPTICTDPSLEQLHKANQHYISIIYKLEQENHRLSLLVDFYKQLLDEREIAQN